MGAIQRGSASNVCDSIGKTYTSTHKPDSHIAAKLDAALGDAKHVLNVGAETGSCEPVHRHVIDLEPSATMISQRAVNSPSVVRGVAEFLPFLDRSFDATMAVLTFHHLTDQSQGLVEVMRVTCKRIVMLTFDPLLSDNF